MRPVKDFVGDVSKDGTVIHQNVRVLTDDAGRVAIFLGRKAPDYVYGPDEVSWTVSRRPCACKNDAPRNTLWRLWEASDRQAARAS